MGREIKVVKGDLKENMEYQNSIKLESYGKEETMGETWRVVGSGLYPNCGVVSPCANVFPHLLLLFFLPELASETPKEA